MFDPRALEQIAAAPDPAETRAFVLEFRGAPDITGASRRERMESARSAWAAVKGDTLARLAAVPGVDVQDHASSPQAVVAAPVSVWKSWAAPGGLLARDAAVQVLPDVEFVAL